MLVANEHAFSSWNTYGKGKFRQQNRNCVRLKKRRTPFDQEEQTTKGLAPAESPLGLTVKKSSVTKDNQSLGKLL